MVYSSKRILAAAMLAVFASAIAGGSTANAGNWSFSIGVPYYGVGTKTKPKPKVSTKNLQVIQFENVDSL